MRTRFTVRNTCQTKRSLTSALVCVTLGLSACTAELSRDAEGENQGSVGDGDQVDGDKNQVPPPAYAPPPGMLRRLTRSQFQNAVSDLLNVKVDTLSLDPDSHNGEFAAIGATSVVTSSRGAEQYQTAIENAVALAFSDEAKVATLIGCEPTLSDQTCVQSFVESFGRRAWRRPLSETEVTRLVELFDLAGSELESPNSAIQWVITALLGSPHFIYRPELGEPQAGGNNRLSNYELAARLSFLLWNSAPDEQLLDDAEAGRLTTAEGRRAVAERLLAAPQGREAVSAFAEDYMRLDRVPIQPKDSALFPTYTPALQAGMVKDMRETWAKVAYDNNENVLRVFSTPEAFVNAELAASYGLDVSGLGPDTFAARTLPNDSVRTGILSRAGFLSQFANQKEGSPTLRGKFIREAIMCRKVPSPPANVALEIPESLDGMPTTKRERLAMHASVKACASCHAMMDPLGLPLEQFDAIGQFRTEEQGLVIDPSGEFDGVPVSDARSLGEVMSTSSTVADCIVRKYYQYALGHEERKVDEVVIDELSASFEATDHKLLALILEIVSHSAFSTVAPQE